MKKPIFKMISFLLSICLLLEWSIPEGTSFFAQKESFKHIAPPSVLQPFAPNPTLSNLEIRNTFAKGLFSQETLLQFKRNGEAYIFEKGKIRKIEESDFALLLKFLQIDDSLTFEEVKRILEETLNKIKEAGISTEKINSVFFVMRNKETTHSPQLVPFAQDGLQFYGTSLGAIPILPFESLLKASRGSQAIELSDLFQILFHEVHAIDAAYKNDELDGDLVHEQGVQLFEQTIDREVPLELELAGVATDTTGERKDYFSKKKRNQRYASSRARRRTSDKSASLDISIVLKNWKIILFLLLTPLALYSTFYFEYKRFLQTYGLEKEWIHANVISVQMFLGTDYHHYWWGPQAFFDHSINPYDNEKMHQFLTQDGVSTGFPNPHYDERLIEANFAKHEGHTMLQGYTATPFNLWFFYPITKLMPYVVSMNLYLLFSLIGYISILVFYTKRIIKQNLPKEKLKYALPWVILLFVGLFNPAQRSFAFVQLDVFYLFPLALSILILTSAKHLKKWHYGLAGALIAFSGAIKIFPFIFGFYLIYKVIKGRWLSVSSKEKEAVIKKYLPAVKGFFVTAILLTVLTFIIVGRETIMTWVDKMIELKNMDYFYDYMYRPSFYQYVRNWNNWFVENISKPVSPVVNYIYYISAVTLLPVYYFLTRNLSEKYLLVHIAFIFTLLPIIFPHWWLYYNIIMVIPFLVIFYYSYQVDNNFIRKLIQILLIPAFLLMHPPFVRILSNYLSLNPTIEELFNTLKRVKDNVTLDENLRRTFYDQLSNPLVRYSPAFQQLEYKTFSLKGVISGFPANLLLFLSNFLLLISLPKLKKNLLVKWKESISSDNYQELNNFFSLFENYKEELTDKELGQLLKNSAIKRDVWLKKIAIEVLVRENINLFMAAIQRDDLKKILFDLLEGQDAKPTRVHLTMKDLISAQLVGVAL